VAHAQAPYGSARVGLKAILSLLTFYNNLVRMGKLLGSPLGTEGLATA